MLLFKERSIQTNINQVLTPKYMLNDTVFNIFKGHVIFPPKKFNKDVTRLKAILVLFLTSPKSQFVH